MTARYLAAERPHIVSLRGSLLYGPTVYLVRKEYEIIYENLWSYKGDRMKDPLEP